MKITITMQEEIEDIIMKKLSGESLSQEEGACFEAWCQDEEHQEYSLRYFGFIGGEEGKQGESMA